MKTSVKAKSASTITKAKSASTATAAPSAGTTIGDSVWVFDENRRVYTKPAKGKVYSSGPPIWREHWRQMWIIGENRRSWLLGWVKGGALQTKNMTVGKDALEKGTASARTELGPVRVLRTELEVERAAWAHDHDHTIARCVDACIDPDTLAAIAMLVGLALPPLPGGMSFLALEAIVKKFGAMSGDAYASGVDVRDKILRDSVMQSLRKVQQAKLNARPKATAKP